MLIKKVIIDKADRMYQMPLDILSFLPAGKRQPLLKRPAIIDLASFKWPVTFPSQEQVAATDLAPASEERLDELKEVIAGWMLANHQVRLNPAREVFIGGGISQMAFALGLATIDAGDVAFVPELALPLYRKVVVACGGDPIFYPFSPKTNWRPDFEKIKSRIGRIARVLFLNSPHNPTGSELTEKDLAALVLMASRENTVVVNDAAYQSISGRLPVSLLGVEGARKVAIELYSFSYNFGLPPLRFGFAVGNRDLVGGLKMAYSLMDQSIPGYYVELALRAIRQYPNAALTSTRTLLGETSGEAAELLRLLNLDVYPSPGVPFLWGRIERRAASSTLVRLLYRRNRVLIAPGTSFGDSGQGFVRLSLTAGPKAYAEAIARVKQRSPYHRLESGE
ncbi:MAG: aminotransferase class I/II-fold pyridoxal phosphate-dependent enzyme [Candidatus Zixiibacteriota bacterium]